jgi:hypothetical protein
MSEQDVVCKKDRRVRQSVCRVCGQSCNPGAGVVLAYGAGGRVHREKCLAIAQKSAVRGDRAAEGTAGGAATAERQDRL